MSTLVLTKNVEFPNSIKKTSDLHNGLMNLSESPNGPLLL